MIYCCIQANPTCWDGTITTSSPPSGVPPALSTQYCPSTACGKPFWNAQAQVQGPIATPWKVWDLTRHLIVSLHPKCEDGDLLLQHRKDEALLETNQVFTFFEQRIMRPKPHQPWVWHETGWLLTKYYYQARPKKTTISKSWLHTYRRINLTFTVSFFPVHFYHKFYKIQGVVRRSSQ